MLKLLSIAASILIAGGAIAQSTQPGATTPSVAPSDTPAVTPSQTPSTTPSQTPAATPSQTPTIPYSRPPMIGEGAVGGLSKCENMIGIEKDRCVQAERAGTGSTGTGTGAGTMGSQMTAPAGSVR